MGGDDELDGAALELLGDDVLSSLRLPSPSHVLHDWQEVSQ